MNEWMNAITSVTLTKEGNVLFNDALNTLKLSMAWR